MLGSDLLTEKIVFLMVKFCYYGLKSENTGMYANVKIKKRQSKHDSFSVLNSTESTECIEFVENYC